MALAANQSPVNVSGWHRRIMPIVLAAGIVCRNPGGLYRHIAVPSGLKHRMR